MVKPTRWLEIILLYTALTAAIVYLIPGDSVLFPIRYVFGFVFVLFMPGYCLVNILFLGKDRIDPVETLVLSVALSFGITGLVLLFFGLSPIGINFTSTTVSLIVVVLVLAVIAFVRKKKAPETVQAPPTEQMP